MRTVAPSNQLASKLVGNSMLPNDSGSITPTKSMKHKDAAWDKMGKKLKVIKKRPTAGVR
jgi:hypothetical protein